MRHGILKASLVSSLVLITAGCVTERTYQGTGIPVAEQEINKEAAARDRMQLGLTYLQRGNSDQAKYNLEQAMEYAPHLEEVHLSMAYYYQKVDDVKRAEKAYERAIHSRTATGDAYNNFGVFLCEQKDYKRSEKMFLAAIEQPKYTRVASSYENLGLCSEEAKEYEKAIKYYEMALNYAPRRTTSIIAITKIKLKLHQYKDANEWLSRYHKIAFQSPESLLLGIDIAKKMNDRALEKQYGLTLLAKFPKSSQAKQYKASMH
ncbi:type IV pilus biogenesis/stability protein PilW [Shewanella sp. OPT22]|uniref:type IV pilus biogenesis/stability protein PilW n=1 Tax=Parashewanella hymeniacidonis TaxID=2807618 RepID=UPI0010202CB8|nr:type IV pilus biogenesis/stability protein PilW [Parashewanella hymeniacidonis]MBM7073724.1 type IV pilus biogenesis/stability protein PilW [Parashewanella hymeniacidonis]RYV02416.1 type IV pilus biogenesis/stability protein PilW [Shewanella sp. OPT22]